MRIILTALLLLASPASAYTLDASGTTLNRDNGVAPLLVTFDSTATTTTDSGIDPRSTTMKKYLQGKKFYIVTFAAAAIWFGETASLLPVGALESSLPLLIMAGGAAVKDTLNRLVNK